MSACESMPVCRANCSVATQWALADTDQIEADPDIVGAGVITSFIVTAHTAFVVVVIGYLTFSFEDICKNQADDKIVESIRRLMRRTYRALNRCCRRLCLRPGTKQTNLDVAAVLDRPEAEDDPTRKYRIDAFRGFMLAISDQQLVTGLAMLVAGFGRYSEISIYSANVVSALAYFSTTVHMGTLDFLMTYLRRHGIVKGCRVAAMMSTMVLLVFILVLQLSSTWWVEYRMSNLFVICGFWDFSTQWTTVDEQVRVAVELCVIFGILWAHYDRISTLYSTWGPLPQGEDYLTNRWLVKYNIRDFDYRISAYKQRARELIVQDPSWRRTIKSWKLVESFAFHETRGSRVWEIASQLYRNVYATLLVFSYRNDHGGTVGPFNTMGFGQIVPLFLLSLLIFAAIESFYGYHDAMERIAAHSTATQVTEAAASSHDSINSGSLDLSNSDIADALENKGHHPEALAVDVIDDSDDISVEESALGHSPPQLQNTNPAPKTKIESDAQSEVVGEMRFAPHQSNPKLHAEERHQGQDQSSQERFMLQNRTFSTGVDLSLHSQRPPSELGGVKSTRKQARGKLERASVKTVASITSLDIHGKSVPSPEGYHSSRRIDTEARVGMRIPAAEILRNAVQDDPRSLLARLIQEDMFEIPEVYRIIFAYASLIIVIQATFACAIHSLLGLWALVVIAFLLVFMEVRHLGDFVRRLCRIRALGRKVTDHGAHSATP